MEQLTTKEIQESAEKVMLGLNKEYGREIFKMNEPSMNQIKQKIQEIGLSQRQISALLGKNASYLAGVMRSGLSTEKQAELLRELEMVAKGEPIKTDSEIIAELSQKLAEEQDWRWYKQKELTLTQKYLMEANRDTESFKRRFIWATQLNWVLALGILASVILWSVV